MIRLHVLFFLLLIKIQLSAQIAQERSVQLFSELVPGNNSILLQWEPSPNAESYRISKWDAGSWVLQGNVDAGTTSYEVMDYSMGEEVEFRVDKLGGNSGFGYINTGFNVPLKNEVKRCLVLVDSVLHSPLSNEIIRLIQDIQGDNWTVRTAIVSQNESVQNVKQVILSWFNENPGTKSSVLLLGHIPVPYSGNIVPDGHNNHMGAWPCDAYYGDIDENLWTDNIVNNTTSSDARNHNIPGDGKFDQSTFPSDIEMEIGRVDLSDLPAFNENYIELTRKYLDKNHAFRHAQLDVPRRGMIENNFGSFNEGFAQNGWKNFSPMFGPENVANGDYENTLVDQPHLWAYACGGGSHTSMGGVGNTTSVYVDKEIQAVFVMNFGSYFGDWDRRNNLMRAALGSGMILSNAWAGRPNWQFHHMALGQNIGYCTQLSQNNDFRYSPGFGAGFAHVSLLGDPTLRLHPVKPVSALKLELSGSVVELEWLASEDADMGYLVYRAVDGSSELVTPDPILETSWTDQCLQAGILHRYTVKAVKLESSASGTYVNTSIGISDTITPDSGIMITADFSASTLFERVTFEMDETDVDSVLWEFGDGETSKVIDPEYLYRMPGTKVVCLTVFHECGMDKTCDTLEVESSLPLAWSIDSSGIVCAGDSNGSLAFVHATPLELEYEWSTGSQDSIVTGLAAGVYSVTVTSIVGLTLEVHDLYLSQPDSLMVEVLTTASSGGNDGSAMAAIDGGVPPYDIVWGDGTIDPDRLSPGRYQVTITDDNGCIVVVDFEIEIRTSTVSHESFEIDYYPNPLSGDQLFINNLSDQAVIKGVVGPNGVLRPVKTSKSGNCTVVDCCGWSSGVQWIWVTMHGVSHVIPVEISR